jgi:hypothetical protein
MEEDLEDQDLDLLEQMEQIILAEEVEVDLLFMDQVEMVDQDI